MMRYRSVCSGIEAATVAWEPLGWVAAGFAEIAWFPSAVLRHRYPNVPNFGDFTKIGADDAGSIDILVGGTPCQSFSVAGLRGGLADYRANLALEFLKLAQRLRARWLVWENVPGVLSSNGGRDFGAILGGMVECGYGFAYRVLDAQFFGFHENQRGELTVNDTAGSLKVGGGKPGQGYPAVNAGASVRRLTPRECERLQGFPDDYTLVPVRGKPAADGPRYRALGNSMAVPCMRWIGERIAAVEASP